MLESSVEDYLVKRVEATGGRCLKLVDMGRRGFPDRTVLWDARNVHFIETKTIGGKVKSWQNRYHDDLEALGFRVSVIWTCDGVDRFIADYAPARWK